MSNENTSSYDGPIQHAKLPLPKAQVHAQHPFNNTTNHQLLLDYLKQRLEIGKSVRDSDLVRMVRIDKNVAGWVKLSEEDRQRQQMQDSTGIPQAKLLNLPLGYVHLDDMMTYFAQTFAPNRGMFYHTGKPDEVGPASQIVTLMNNHALYAGYYREVLLTLFGLLKYNSGGFKIAWSTDIGPKIVPKADGTGPQIVQEIQWQGNRISSLDNYNFFRDPSVHPTKLYCEGEFAATAEMRSVYWLQNKASQGIYFNCEDALANFVNRSACTYYRNPPAEANLQVSDPQGTDWVSILSQNQYQEQNGMELVEIHIKLDPTQFGLIAAKDKPGRKRYEMWRFTILNGNWIIDATYMNNMHGYLPFFLGVLNDDLMGSSQKSVGEILQPLQDFASFLLNTHVLASRKKLWGFTYYDPSAIDLSSVPPGEVAARIPMKPESYGRDIRTAVYEQTQSRDTNQTMTDLESVMGIINQFFPTQSLPSQIAQIDRAVESQVAAVQQGANRRQQKAARLLDDSLFRPARFAMYYNILQYQPNDGEVQDYYTGKPVKLSLDELRNTDMPFIIGQGLKAIDRQAAAQQLQQIIFAMIQAPQAAQGVKMLDLIDYWTSMIDIDIDFKQFEMTPEDQAAQAAAANGEKPIQPATNPQALDQPIYGS